MSTPIAIGKEKRFVIKAMHMPAEFPKIIETNYCAPAPILEDDLKLVLRHFEGPMGQRVPNVLCKRVVSLLRAASTEDVSEWAQRRCFCHLVQAALQVLASHVLKCREHQEND